MKYLLIFMISFVVIYLLYFIVIVSRKKGLESFKNGKQFEFFVKKYELNKSKLNIKSFANSFAFINAFIIALTFTILELFNNLVLKLVLCVFILVPLMLIMYNFLGRHYKKKEGR